MESFFGIDANVDYLNLYLIPWAINLVSALAVFIIGRWIAKLVVKALSKVMQRGKVDETLINFLGNVMYVALLIVVIIAALDQLGVNTTSILAVFATAGLAVGLALKDSLSNFAAGVMLIIFKPFRVGDYVEAGGSAGTVESIRIFNTLMKTPDNREITVPNGQIYSGTITNVTARQTRRVDLIFGIGYSDDLEKARNLIWEAINNEDRILKDPEPAVVLMELAESSVNIAVRTWVSTSDYWPVRAALLEKIKVAFDGNDITIPFPQRDVHLYQVGA
ncbi:MAG: mechanosensitive ion channel [Gammaproteobacteria bacterium]|jgi:small conductance mechanosensitive channel